MNTLSPLASEIIRCHFRVRREIGERFPSIRALASQFSITRYQAEIACQELAEAGFIESHGNAGFFLKGDRRLLRKTQSDARPHPGIVWPVWGDHANAESLTGSLRIELEAAAKASQWKLVAYEDPGSWDDGIFSVRLKAREINLLIGIGCPQVAEARYGEILETGCRLLLHGTPNDVTDHLQIPTIDGDHTDVTIRLVATLHEMGIRNPLMIGSVPQRALSERRRAFMDGLARVIACPTADNLLVEPDLEYQSLALRDRFLRGTKPDALIFNNTYEFRETLKYWPELAAKADTDLRVVIYDDIGLNKNEMAICCLRVVHDVPKTAAAILALMTSMLAHKAVALRTVVPKQILAV